MALGRDLRSAIFHRVGDFSAQEVSKFGAPTLISRNTNDVTQVQMVVFMALAIMVSAPISMIGGIIMALRQDVGAVRFSSRLRSRLLAIAVGLVIRKMIPQFRLMQTSIDSVNRIMREQITGIRVVRAFVREDFETERFGVANATPDQHRPQRRPAAGADLPDRHDHPQRVDRRRALVRGGPGRERRHAGRRR